MKLHYRLNENDLLTKSISSYLYKMLVLRLILPGILLIIGLCNYFSPAFHYHAIQLAGPTSNTYRSFPDIIAYHPMLDLRMALIMVAFAIVTYYMKAKKLSALQTPGFYSLEVAQGHLKIHHETAEIDFSCKKLKSILVKENFMVLSMGFNLKTILPIVVPLSAFRGPTDQDDFIDEIKKSIPSIVVIEESCTRAL